MKTEKISPLQAGSSAPSFDASDDQGNRINKKKMLGKRYLIYFYPRDNTPGCNLEATGFVDLYNEFETLGVKIIGISGDNCISHQKFRTKFSIPFPLLLDEDHEIAKSFGVYGEKKFMGKVYNGIHRISFLINEGGKIQKTYLKVKPKEHPQEVYRDLVSAQKVER